MFGSVVKCDTMRETSSYVAYCMPGIVFGRGMAFWPRSSAMLWDPVNHANCFSEVGGRTAILCSESLGTCGVARFRPGVEHGTRPNGASAVGAGRLHGDGYCHHS